MLEELILHLTGLLEDYSEEAPRSLRASTLLLYSVPLGHASLVNCDASADAFSLKLASRQSQSIQHRGLNVLGTMPPHLHPRSTATSTLFVGTLLASFVVVGIPHVFPCPRPRRGHADAQRLLDSEGRPIRRKPRQETSPESPMEEVPMKVGNMGIPQSKTLEEEAALFQQLQQEAEVLEKEARECPVPKPRGVIGYLLGFEEAKPVLKGSEKS